MPTPVSVARQCLTEEAARALDDAVEVARRRSHAQTTSLHAVSALLGLPSSALRDACARARSSPYNSRLQFRALELCVGVSLDRLPSSTTKSHSGAAEDEPPPISNSLMAAIKRSQANQRRHPENFHLQQLHFNNNINQQTTSVLKVELKHFILSILDDPIVSRVFGEAGFRSCDIKLAVIHPPVTQSAKFSRSRCPPIFLCNLPGSGSDPFRPGFSFPFNGYEDVDENCRRIGEALVKPIGKAKNPLLVGVCASDALKRFIECVSKDNKARILPSEIAGLTVICIEKEITEFVTGGSGEGKMGLVFDDLGHRLERSSGPGIVVSFGELKVLVGEGVSNDAVSYLVSKLTGLLEGFRGKLWLVGAAASYEMYSKFLERFPSVEKDWDLEPLPITSSKTSVEKSFGSKSSLMGSFVPFGGFFSAPSDVKNPLSSTNKSIPRCHLCTAKYEQEVATIMKIGSTISVADQYSENLPPWLQMAELETSKGPDMAKAKDDGRTLNAKILGLQKKWNDICQRLHLAQPFSKFNDSLAGSQAPISDSVQYFGNWKDGSNSSSSSSRDSLPNGGQYANLSVGVNIDPQNVFPAKQSVPVAVASEVENAVHHSKPVEEVSKSSQKGKESPWLTCQPLPNVSLNADRTSSSSVTSVTTDLGLGILYASSAREPNSAKLSDHKEQLRPFSVSNSVEFDPVNENTSHHIAHSPSCPGPYSMGQLDLTYYKSVRRVLSEKVHWQDRAISSISEAVSRCKAGYGRNRGSNGRGDIWLTFLGPDKVGQRRIASTLAEIMFGSHENLISVDLRSHDRVSPSNSIFVCPEVIDYDVKFRGKTVVDHIARGLSKKPHSVIFLENVNKADLQAQNSLSQAIRTGKFPDSHGREISINGMIFVTTSAITAGKKSFMENKSIKFSEEMILRAKSWQMQILIKHGIEGASRNNEMNVRALMKESCTMSSVNKRKLNGTSESTEQEINFEADKRACKALRSYLDLNLPLEETEENLNYSECDSDSMSENSEAWLEDFFHQVDEKIAFEPFDFDALAVKIMKEINIQFQKVFGSEVLLEIDDEVMVQILAASWLSDRKGAVEDWIEKVLGVGFTKARQKCHLSVHFVVKLVTCEGLSVEKQASGVCLPSRINL